MKKQGKKAHQEITKGIQERSTSAYVCLERRGIHEIWSIDPIIFLTSRTGVNLDRKLLFLGGKIWLCFLYILYIDDRLYLPQGNMHQQPPQLSMEVIYRTFCDPTLTSFLQSKEHMQLKGKGAVVSTTELPHWAMQGKTEESLPQAVFCILLPSLDSPRWACEPGWLAVSLYNVWKRYQNSQLGSNKAKLTVAISNKYMCNGFPATGLHMLAYLLKVSIYGESSQRLSQA